jgi:type IV pilus assembly protein PilF
MRAEGEKPMKSLLKLSMITGLMLSLAACASTSPSIHRQYSNNERAAGYNVQLSYGYLQQGDYSRAKKKCLLALQQAPHWPPALNAMAYLYERTGDVERAEEYYKRALRGSSDQATTQNNYGAFLCRQARYETGVKYIIKAARDETYINAAKAYENAGLCAMQIPDKEKAIAYFKRALLLDPRRENAQAALLTLERRKGLKDE